VSDPYQDGDDGLRSRLRALRVDPPDEGFGARLHRRLAELDPPGRPGVRERLRAWRPRGVRLGWMALGAAAAVVALVLVGLPGNRPSGRTDPPAAAATALPFTKVAMIHLNLSTDVAVASAAIEVQLPEGLVFWSGGRALAQRTLAWSQPLAAGGNEIPIAVRGERPGRYRVKVKARIGGERVEDEIPLEVVEG